MVVKTAERSKGEVVPAGGEATTTAVALQPKLAGLARSVGGLVVGYAQAIDQANDAIERAFLMGEGVQALRKAITEEAIAPILGLMNSPMGFLTDRGPHAYREDMKKEYAPAVVKECLVQSLLLGLRPTNNEWNIISGRCYVAMNGWYRKLCELPGITDVNVAPGTPRLAEGSYVVRVAVSWRLHGVPDQLYDHEGKPGRAFTIEVKGKAGIDQVIGKAKARAYRAAYEKATGSVATLPDAEEAHEPPARAALGQATRAQQALGHLPAAPPAAPRQATVAQVEEVLRRHQVGEDEWLALADANGWPYNPGELQPAQAGEVLDHFARSQPPAAE